MVILSTESRFAPRLIPLEHAVMDGLQTGLGPIEFYAEYLDLNRFPGEDYQRQLSEYLRVKYAERRPDLLIIFYTRTLAVLGSLLTDVFLGVPTIAAGLSEEANPGVLSGVRFPGTAQRLDLRGTVDLILRLHPDTRRIVVISGKAELDRVYMERAKQISRTFATNRVEFDFWSDRSVVEMRKAVSVLPARTVILFTTVIRDAAGETFFPPEVARLLAASANAPMYVIGDMSVGGGAVGGSVLSYEDQGRRIATMARRILTGTAPDSLPLEVLATGVPTFDWRALQRWGISESHLPPGSVVRFKPPSIWEHYHWYIIGALIIFALQAAMIGALLLQGARRRRAEQEARGLHRRILTAHEDERRRLARDLHDDLTQRLARLAIDAGKIERSVPASDHSASGRSMREELVRLSEDVHALSYRLHPSLLDDLGLLEALNAECDGFSRRESIPIEFKPRDVPRDLPRETALCLFRIAQESLRNVARHAGATAVEVSLRRVDGGLEMAVSDNGAGFDPARDHRPSLGLASMKERVQLLGGELDIESAPGHGTTVVAWLGLNGDEKL